MRTCKLLLLIVIGVYIMVSPIDMVEAGNEKSLKLIELAKKEFGNLAKPDLLLLHAVANGLFAIYSPKTEQNNDPVKFDQWSDSRVLKARLISWLCNNPEASDLVSKRGIKIIGARIDGNLDLQHTTILFPLHFEKSAIPDGILLTRSIIQDLDLIGTFTGPIKAYGLKVKGSILLCQGFRADGEVEIIGANIGGDLVCDNAEFFNKGKTALNAGRINVKGSVILTNNFVALGEVILRGANIAGYLDCRNSTFINEDKRVFSAENINTGKSVYLHEGFIANGSVNFSGSKIGGNLNCQGGQFINPNGTEKAFNGQGLRVDGTVLLRKGFKAIGQVSLIGAKINGDLDCIAGSFINGSLTALSADRIIVKGSVFLRSGFKAEGLVRLLGASIDGDFDCGNGNFLNKGSIALSLDGSDIRGSTFLGDGFYAEGEVRLRNASIGGVLNCRQATFLNEKGKAINAHGLKISGLVFMGQKFKALGKVDLNNSVINGNFECSDDTQFINKGLISLSLQGTRIKGAALLGRKFKSEGQISLIGATIESDLDCYQAEFINDKNPVLVVARAKVGGDVHFGRDTKAEGQVIFNNTIDNTQSQTTTAFTHLFLGVVWFKYAINILNGNTSTCISNS